jgi:ABC-type phosphate transport system permease subunit
MGYAAVGSLWQQALLSIGLVLFLFVLLLVGLPRIFIKRRKEQ